jgi:hypothetical protein
MVPLDYQESLEVEDRSITFGTNKSIRGNQNMELLSKNVFVRTGTRGCNLRGVITSEVLVLIDVPGRLRVNSFKLKLLILSMPPLKMG